MSTCEQRAKQRELNKTEEQDDTVDTPISTSENEKKVELPKPKLDATSSDDGTSGSDSDDEPPPLLGPDDDFQANIEKRMKSITALVTSFRRKLKMVKKS